MFLVQTWLPIQAQLDNFTKPISRSPFVSRLFVWELNRYWQFICHLIPSIAGTMYRLGKFSFIPSSSAVQINSSRGSPSKSIVRSPSHSHRSARVVPVRCLSFQVACFDPIPIICLPSDWKVPTIDNVVTVNNNDGQWAVRDVTGDGYRNTENGTSFLFLFLFLCNGHHRFRVMVVTFVLPILPRRFRGPQII